MEVYFIYHMHEDGTLNQKCICYHYAEATLNYSFATTNYM